MKSFQEELEYYCDYKNQDITCFLDLGDPIDKEYIKTHTKGHNNRKRNEYGLEEKRVCPENLMDESEANYALKLLDQGLILYREPILVDCNSCADFYVFHPELEEGVLVEITRYEKGKANGKKNNQHKNLRECCKRYGIPFIALFKEDLEKMGILEGFNTPEGIPSSHI